MRNRNSEEYGDYECQRQKDESAVREVLLVRLERLNNVIAATGGNKELRAEREQVKAEIEVTW